MKIDSGINFKEGIRFILGDKVDLRIRKPDISFIKKGKLRKRENPANKDIPSR